MNTHLDGWFSSHGIIRYDPPRGSMKSRTKWWCVIEADPELARYYRSWVNTQGNPLGLPRDNLCLPSWGSHVSVIRGEQPREDLKHLWGRYEGQRVSFQYRAYPRHSGDTTGDRPEWFWFLDVRCDWARRIRDELHRPSHWNFHLTVGRKYEARSQQTA